MEKESGVEDENSHNTDEELNNDIILNHMEICVAEAEKRANGTLNIRDFFTVYLIETKVTDPEWNGALNKLSTVWRRYTEFEQLRAYLEVTYPYIVLPPLPEKRVLYGWQKVSTDTFDPDFVDRRRAGLENFLLRIASHQILGHDKHFMEFLQQDDRWKEMIKESSYLQVAESKLKSLSVAVRLKRPDPRFESIKNYSIDLQSNLSNLLRSRAKVVEKQYSVYKLHANYGRVFSEWSAVEKEMGDGLQRAGHYLDTFASSIDAALEDEELFADQLKEYLFFATSLQNVCKKQEILQLELESTEDAVNNKNIEKRRAVQGKSGIMSRLFGTVDTEEVREHRVSVLDQKIKEGESDAKIAKENLMEFLEKALFDMDRFQEQKALDLKETMLGYSLLQLKTAKKGLQAWTQIRDCLASIP
ncbi:sorting nexin-4-like [Chrysoperla carnea]|uniref:sorting nexin-4-like n=1 Tax=Chrysoperla carnea TaxID=189513 RepID=UPI001D07F72D|nr:sorting nexin-4-like [Chrysoperla carnea]